MTHYPPQQCPVHSTPASPSNGLCLCPQQDKNQEGCICPCHLSTYICDPCYTGKCSFLNQERCCEKCLITLAHFTYKCRVNKIGCCHTQNHSTMEGWESKEAWIVGWCRAHDIPEHAQERLTRKIQDWFAKERESAERRVQESVFRAIDGLPCHSHGGVLPDGRIPAAVLVEDLHKLEAARKDTDV